MKTRSAIGFSFAALLLLSCASPFLESARDPNGFSGGLGVVAVGAVIPVLDTDQFTDHFAVMPVADARYGFNNVFSLSVQLGAGYAQGLDYPERYFDLFDSTGVFCASAYASAKLYVGEDRRPQTQRRCIRHTAL